MKRFGDAVRRLMEMKSVTGLQLASDIGLSTTSISRILKGQTRPRQLTLTRIMQRLCENKEEKQVLLRAYSGLVEGLPEEILLDGERNAIEQRARAERYLEVKTQSIAFRESVGRELKKLKIPFQSDYREKIFTTDFLVESQGLKVALECKFNVHRDFEKTVTVAEILLEKLECDKVCIVVPYEESGHKDLSLPEDGSIPLLPVTEISTTFS